VFELISVIGFFAKTLETAEPMERHFMILKEDIK
jgi:hypothetical protein